MVPLTVNVATDVHTAINRLEDASLVIPRCITDLKNEVEEALAAEAAKKKPVQNVNQSLGKSSWFEVYVITLVLLLLLLLLVVIIGVGGCCRCCWWWLLMLLLRCCCVVVGDFWGELIQCIY